MEQDYTEYREFVGEEELGEPFGSLDIAKRAVKMVRHQSGAGNEEILADLLDLKDLVDEQIISLRRIHP